MPFEKLRRCELRRGKRSVFTADSVVVIGGAAAGVGSVIASKPEWFGAGLGTTIAAGAGSVVAHFLGARLPRSGNAQQRAARAMLDFLVSDDAFRAVNHGQQVDPGRPLYRATAFWPVCVGERPLLIAMLRACKGSREITVADSAVAFAAGEPFAGLAWTKVGEPVTRDDLQSIDDFSGNNRLARWRDQWRDRTRALQVPDHVIARLGE